MANRSYDLTPAHRLSFPLPDLDVRQLAEAQKLLAESLDPEATWRTAEFRASSSWSVLAPYTLRYRRTGRWVHMQGLGVPGVVTSGTILTNLTFGFRPSRELHFACAAGASGNTSPGGMAVVVRPDGNVALDFLTGASRTWASFDSIRFLAEDNYPPI